MIPPTELTTVAAFDADELPEDLVRRSGVFAGPSAVGESIVVWIEHSTVYVNVPVLGAVYNPVETQRLRLERARGLRKLSGPVTSLPEGQASDVTANHQIRAAIVSGLKNRQLFDVATALESGTPSWRCSHAALRCDSVALIKSAAVILGLRGFYGMLFCSTKGLRKKRLRMGLCERCGYAMCRDICSECGAQGGAR